MPKVKTKAKKWKMYAAMKIKDGKLIYSLFEEDKGRLKYWLKQLNFKSRIKKVTVTEGWSNAEG